MSPVLRTRLHFSTCPPGTWSSPHHNPTFLPSFHTFPIFSSIQPVLSAFFLLAPLFLSIPLSSPFHMANLCFLKVALDLIFSLCVRACVCVHICASYMHIQGYHLFSQCDSSTFSVNLELKTINDPSILKGLNEVPPFSPCPPAFLFLLSPILCTSNLSLNN